MTMQLHTHTNKSTHRLRMWETELKTGCNLCRMPKSLLFELCEWEWVALQASGDNEEGETSQRKRKRERERVSKGESKLKRGGCMQTKTENNEENYSMHRNTHSHAHTVAQRLNKRTCKLFFIFIFSFEWVHVCGSRSFAHLSSTATQYWVDADANQCLWHVRQKTCNSLAPYIRTDTKRWRCIDGSRKSSVLQRHHNLWNISVMIMPILLFRYFGTCVNSCCITFVLHNVPFLHVVK